MKAAGDKVTGAHGHGGPRLTAVRSVLDETAYLYRIIQTIGSGPDLDAILRGTVQLVTEATACHACFIYFLQGHRLALRAASSMYAHLEGHVSMAIGEGLGGWVAKTRRSAFIRENALEDPRVKYFPELEEERFQSLVSVPIFARGGDVIGVINLHAEAPHEFARADLDFLEHTASLVAGAIENAQLYEDATSRVALLTDLSRLAQRIASAGSVEELLPTVAAGCRKLLAAARCEIYLLDGDEQLTLGAASPRGTNRPALDLRRVWMEALEAKPDRAHPEEPQALAEALWGDVSGTPLFAPLTVGDERLGLLAALVSTSFGEAHTAMAAVASHTAVAIKRHQLIEWLTEKNLVKDFFEALSRGWGETGELEGEAARLGCDLAEPHVVLHAGRWMQHGITSRRRGRGHSLPDAREPAGWLDLAARLETRLSATLPGTLFDHRETSVRGLIRAPDGDASAVVDTVRRAHEEVFGGEPPPIVIGLSNVCRRATSFRQGFEEALSAAEVGPLIRGGPGVYSYEDLGAYRYLLSSDRGVRDKYQNRLERLADYDRKRGTRLLETLEAYLDGRGSIVGTARAMYIHSNTLRQRLSRIERVAELAFERDDWLSLAIAIKLVKLRLMRRSASDEGRGTDG